MESHAMEKRNRRGRDVLVMGFALFSMFFGAGNTVFPPYLGLGAAADWMYAFFAYFFADIGLAVVAVFAMLKIGGDIDAVTARLGKLPGIIMASAIILCIGPLLAIPRTGATTYELGVKTLCGEGPAIAVLSSIFYFGIVLLLTLKETAVVEMLGKYLTPALVIGLVALIVKGVATPIGPITEATRDADVIADGIAMGYQTMDVLAALAYGVIVLRFAERREGRTRREKHGMVAGASLVAAGVLFVVYCGLAYLGATTSSIREQDGDQAALVLFIIRGLLGEGGLVLLGAIVSLACLTTAVALVSTTSEYFSRLSKRRVGYRTLVVAVCVFSTVLSNVGLEAIIAIAVPILGLVYPGTLVLVVLVFFDERIPNHHVYRCAVAGAMAASLLKILNDWGAPLGFVSRLPLAAYGFFWVVPAFVCFLAGFAIFGRSRERQPYPRRMENFEYEVDIPGFPEEEVNFTANNDMHTGGRGTRHSDDGDDNEA